MNSGRAFAIFRDIYNKKIREADKLAALKKVLEAETTNSITKQEFKTALKWLFEQVVEEVKEDE